MPRTVIHIVPHDWNEGGILQEQMWVYHGNSCTRRDHTASYDCCTNTRPLTPDFTVIDHTNGAWKLR